MTLTASLDVPTVHKAGHEAHKPGQKAAQAHQNGPQAGQTVDSVHTGHPEDSSPARAAHGSSASTEGGKASPAISIQGTPTKPPKPLNELEKRFAFEYAQDFNATRAYMRATGMTREATAATMGYRWFNRVEIRAQIDVETAEIRKRAGVNTDDMVRRLWGMFTADARELVEHVVECCRYCHGIDGLYQRTDTELRRDRLEHATTGRQRVDGIYVSKRKRAKNDPDAEEAPPFQEQGGGGFDPHKPPNEHCGSCHGYGITRAVFKDTRLLSPAAALLYQGVEETKEGLKVRFIDQLGAFEKLAKHTGFYDADNRQRKPDDPFAALLARISGPSAALPINPNPKEGDDE